LTALGKWSNDRSTEQEELLTAFMEPVVAAVAEFAKLENEHMRGSIATVQTCRKIFARLLQCITAKDTRAHFATISSKLEDAMILLQLAVGVADLVQGGEISLRAKHIDETVR
jgi:hypothetical protein